MAGWVRYSRPFVDDTSFELIVEIGGESTVLDINTMRADFRGLAKARIASLVQVVANKMNLPTKAPLGLMMISGRQDASPAHTPLSEEHVKVRVDRDSDVTLDGECYQTDHLGTTSPTADTPVHVPSKRKRTEDPNLEGAGEWIIHQGLWRLRVLPNAADDGSELIFVAVKLEAFTGQRARNRKRSFLT
jgi:hypothetical protein